MIDLNAQQIHLERLSILSLELNYEIGFLIDDSGPTCSFPRKTNVIREVHLYTRSIRR